MRAFGHRALAALRLGAIGAIGLGLLAPVTAGILDRFYAVTVLPVAPASPEVVALNRTLHEGGQSVAEIYGVPMAGPMRVLFPPDERLVRPREDPGQLLLLVDKQRGDNPLQVKTVWFVAWRLGAGLAVLGLVGLVVTFWAARRGRDRQRRSREATQERVPAQAGRG